jgi:NADPH-dependent 2,4-dienoyl-CoA reductase/sulfur reductase-like enzyme
VSRRDRLDLVVIGGGPGGLAAADAAASVGANVLLLDQGARPGGQIWRHRKGDRLPSVAQQLIGAVHPPRVSIANRASLIDAHDAHSLIVSFNGRVATVETSNVILATGATERFLPFPGWTSPGVVGVGALQSLIKSGLRVTGSRIVVAGSGPLSLPVAATVARAGADLKLIAEQASRAALWNFSRRLLFEPSKLRQAARLRLTSWRTRYRADSWPVRVEADSQGVLEAVVMNVAGREQRIECDWLATNAGLVPRTEAGELLGCKLRRAGIDVDERQATSVDHVFAVGECTGIKGEEGARLEGVVAGLVAAGATDIPASLIRARDRIKAFGQLLETTFAPRAELSKRADDDTVLCRCEDVLCSQIDPAWSQRQAKLYTRVGMGACQGSVCGPACETLYGWQRNSVRPPLEQPTVGSWANGLTVPDS